MARALLVTSSFLPGKGGIESYLAQLCSALSPSLAVLAPRMRDGKALPSDLGYPVTGFAKQFLVPGRRTLRLIEETAARHSADRILFGTPWPLALLGPALKRRGYSYASVIHGAETTVPGAIPGLGKLVAASLAAADLLLPVSHYTGDRVRTLLDKYKQPHPPFERLPARVDLDRFHPKTDTRQIRDDLGLRDSDKMVLSFGRLARRKGAHRLIQAWPAVSAAVPEATLVIAGTGPRANYLQRLARANDVKVTFPGRISDEQAPALYASASVFAFPVVDRWFGLEGEGLGIVLVEAQASGVPCVTGRSGGTPEAVIDSVTGFVVEASDPRALSEAITSLLQDDSLAHGLGRAGRRHVTANFSDRTLPEAFSQWLG
ncbi:MAG: glycosyltransferase family 4 protein [Actinobacteria bacterium]|nr:glycosyltransferase family 4 protein [Actinomycetota bacterium]